MADLEFGDRVLILVRDYVVQDDGDTLDCEKYEFDLQDVVGVFKEGN